MNTLELKRATSFPLRIFWLGAACMGAFLVLSGCLNLRGDPALLARQEVNLVRLGEMRASLIRYNELSLIPESQLSADEAIEYRNLSGARPHLENEMTEITDELNDTYVDRSGKIAKALSIGLGITSAVGSGVALAIIGLGKALN